ncbi:MAG TPA: hypothetical protein VN032_03700 [Thermoanaerobaculia bacterium]|jgi:hypothetical protein|nr:hypothetical protein [Thermoanaerobaculia bacterium]
MMISRNRGLGKTPAPNPLFVALAAAVLAAAPGFADDPSRDWPQWGRTPQHGGASSVVAQPLQVILANLVYDPFVEQMKADNGGELLAHYSVPLVDETGVYMVFKSGVYTGFGKWGSLAWSVKKLQWIAGQLEVVWTFDTDWVPEPLALTNWEPVLLPAISGDDLYVPGLGGTVFRVSKETGLAQVRLNPFSSVDPSRYVAGGLAVAADGGVVYDAVGLSASDPFAPITGAWLVKIATDGTTSLAQFATLVSGAPGPTDACQDTFSQDQLPWPPSTTATPPTVLCGSQRPGINVVPAVAPDGTIYTLSRAHGSDRYSALVAVHADLTPAWSASLRGILDDGCGVLLLDDGSNLGCRAGANTGVDPSTNDRPAGRVNDSGTSSPVVLPDGSILVGALTTYNFFRGHLFKFSRDGDALATYDFGWDITPAVFAHDGTYSILLKDNHYTSSDGSAFYDVTSLDADLVPEWRFRATNTEDCARQPDGTVTCVDDSPEGFEWCVNQPAVDATGTVYLNSEDGTLYGFDHAGAVVSQIFLDTALGAAYTPVALGPDGILYAQNNGRLFAVGQQRFPRDTPARAPVSVGPPRVVVRP